jgi:hypothetical protein
MAQPKTLSNTQISYIQNGELAALITPTLAQNASKPNCRTANSPLSSELLESHYFFPLLFAPKVFFDDGTVLPGGPFHCELVTAASISLSSLRLDPPSILGA